MAIRAKTKHRLLILTAVTAAFVVALVSFYVYRKHKLNVQALAWRAKGMADYKSGHYQDAMNHLGRFIRRDPSDPTVLDTYAKARLKVPVYDGRQYAQAIGILQRVVDLKPDYPGALPQLMDLYNTIGQSTEANDAADRVLKRDPGNAEAVRVKIVSLMQLRRFDDALKFANRMLARNKAGKPEYSHDVRVQAMRGKAAVLIQLNHPNQALAAARAYNSLAPDQFDGYLLTLQLLGQTQASDQQIIDEMKKVQQAHAKDPRFAVLLVAAYDHAHDFKQAMKWAKTAAQALLRDPQAIMILVHQLDGLNQFQLSTAVIAAAYKSADHVGIKRMIARRLLETGQLQTLLADLKSLDPASQSSDSELLGLKALALSQRGKSKQITPILDTLASRQHDKAAQAWNTYLSNVSTAQSTSPTKVISACSKALNDDPDVAFFLYSRGVAYHNIGEDALASNDWRAAAQAAPAWSAPLLELSSLANQQGKQNAALQLAHAALQRSPGNRAVLMTFAASLVQDQQVFTGSNISKITKLVDNLLKQQPDSPGLISLRIAIEASRGQKSEAAQMLKGMLDNSKIKPSGPLLLHLAQVSSNASLGLADACLKRYRSLYGSDASLGYAQAQMDASHGQIRKGLSLIDNGLKSAKADAKTDWEIARARYLQNTASPKAPTAWINLANSLPGNIHIQRLALDVPATWQDRKFVAKAIDRIRQVTGKDGLSWRIYQARLLLTGKDRVQQADKVVHLLVPVDQLAPQMVQPHLLLAQAYQLQNNLNPAMTQMQKAVNLQPDVPAIQLQLANLYQKQGEFNQAKTILQKLADSDKASPQQLRAAAVLLEQQGQRAAAIDLLNKVLARGGHQSATQLLLARLYLAEGKTSQAADIYEKLLKHPTARIIGDAARFYLAIGQKAQASETIARLKDLKISGDQRNLILADYESQAGDAKSAVSHIEQIVRAAPKDVDAWISLVRYQLALGQPDKAINVAKQAINSVSSPALKRLLTNAKLVEQADQLQDLRPMVLAMLDPDQHVAAIKALQLVTGPLTKRKVAAQTLDDLKQLANNTPQMLALQVLAARLELAAGNADDAANLALNASQRFPNAVAPALIASKSFAAAGHWDRALHAAKIWRSRSAANPVEPDLMIARAESRLGDVQNAMAQIKPHLAAALKHPNRNAATIATAVKTMIIAGLTPQAADTLEPLIGKSAQWRRFAISMAGGLVPKQEQAAAWLTRVAKAIPAGDDQNRVLLAQAWRALDERFHQTIYTPKARAILDPLVARKEAPADAILLLAVIDDATGHRSTAASEYRRVLKIKPDSAMAANNLAMILLQTHRDLDEAVALARKAVKEASDAPPFIDTLASALAANGQPQAAIKQWRHAISLDPNNPMWYLNLANMQVKADLPAEARSTLKQLDQQIPDASKLPPSLRQQLRTLRQKSGISPAGA